MSVNPCNEPDCTTPKEPDASGHTEPSVELEITARKRELGDGFTVRRLLPTVARKMVGPFIFVDHMGPVKMAEGKGLDVRPHPHINLATVTFLFEGEILHRDSLGNEQIIRPGAVNWMTAGRGIAHSERSPAAERKSGAKLHGMQLWVALPKASEEVAPTFQHHPADTIPSISVGGARLQIVAGSAYGETSPVRTLSKLFYVAADLDAGSDLEIPNEYAGRAAYIVDGRVTEEATIAEKGKPHPEGTMIVFREGAPARIRAVERTRVMLLGGAPLDGPRNIYWNFVSSSLERIEQAKSDWRNDNFPKIPGDDKERIPLPES